MSYIYNTFWAVKNIVIRVNIDLDDFRYWRGGKADQIQDLFQFALAEWLLSRRKPETQRLRDEEAEGSVVEVAWFIVGPTANGT